MTLNFLWFKNGCDVHLLQMLMYFTYLTMKIADQILPLPSDDGEKFLYQYFLDDFRKT
jgi:hypothetical protein